MTRLEAAKKGTTVEEGEEAGEVVLEKRHWLGESVDLFSSFASAGFPTITSTIPADVDLAMPAFYLDFEKSFCYLRLFASNASLNI